MNLVPLRESRFLRPILHTYVSNIFKLNNPTRNQVRNQGHMYRIWLETHWDQGAEAAGNRKWSQNQGDMNYVAGPCSELQNTPVKIVIS